MIISWIFSRWTTSSPSLWNFQKISKDKINWRPINKNLDAFMIDYHISLTIAEVFLVIFGLLYIPSCTIPFHSKLQLTAIQLKVEVQNKHTCFPEIRNSGENWTRICLSFCHWVLYIIAENCLNFQIREFPIFCRMHCLQLLLS